MRFVVLILAMVCIRLHAATYTAASPAFVDVLTAYNLAAENGDDIVDVPAGTAYWTDQNQLCCKSVWIRGAGTNLTIIADANTDRSESILIWGNQYTNKLARLSHIQWRGDGTNNGQTRFDGIIRVYGTGSIRFDHNFMTAINNRTMTWYADPGGLIDNNVFEQNGRSGALITKNSTGTYWGDTEWTVPIQWGTTNIGVTIENNYFQNTSIRAVADGFAGAGFLFRSNVVYNGSVENHGTETAKRERGGRSIEAYDNIFIGNAGGVFAFLIKSGTGYLHDNDIGANYAGGARYQALRQNTTYDPFGRASGVNVWDDNYPTLYASGTHSGGTSAVLTDSGASWTVNQWAGYSVINTTLFGAGETNSSIGLIESNTATTITSMTPDGVWSQITWSNGNTYNIRRVRQTLDQPGAAEGDLLVGGGTGEPQTPPLNNVTGTYAWPNQGQAIIRFWNNTGTTTVSSENYSIIAGLHYTNTAPSVGYSELVYPHPLSTYHDAAVTVPVRVRGNGSLGRKRL